MKKFLALILIALILTFGFIVFNKKGLEKLGYTKDEIALIENKLNEDDIKYLKTVDYIDNLKDLLNHQDFSRSKFKDYIKYQNDHPNASINDIINNNQLTNKDDNQDKNDNPPTPSNEFADTKYYIADNLERYLDYMNKNTTMSKQQVVSYVNANLDYDYYTNVVNADLNKDTLILVNKYSKLDSNYEPTDLVKLTGKYNKGNKSYLRQVAYDAFIKLSDAASLDNISIFNVSAYRSYDTQAGLYNNYVNKDGKDLADTYSARAGYSEHQTGLALDVNSVDDAFAYTKEYTWLQANAYKYGFIERYPKGKDKITGYQYEPWHYRYVGLEIAKYIHDNNITYDEYYAYFVNK